MATYRELVEIGFEYVGRWTLTEVDRLRIRCALERYADCRTVYAFASDADVLYVGIPAAGRSTLRTRMRGYEQKYISPAKRNPSTSLRSERIAQVLRKGGNVLVYAIDPDRIPSPSIEGKDRVREFEKHLFNTFDLPWNKQGKRRLLACEQTQRPLRRPNGPKC